MNHIHSSSPLMHQRRGSAYMLNIFHPILHPRIHTCYMRVRRVYGHPAIYFTVTSAYSSSLLYSMPRIYMHHSFAIDPFTYIVTTNPTLRSSIDNRLAPLRSSSNYARYIHSPHNITSPSVPSTDRVWRTSQLTTSAVHRYTSSPSPLLRPIAYVYHLSLLSPAVTWK